MRADDPTERLRAVQLSTSPDDLASALDDPSPEIARTAIGRLGEIDGRRAARELGSRLLSADLSLVADIAAALQRLGDRQAVIDLATAGLHEEPYTRRLAAVRALGALRDTSLAGSLRLMLGDEVAGVRVASLRALAAIGSQSGAGADCARSLSDRDAQVRIAAVRAVARIERRPGALLARVAGDPERVVRIEVARHLASLPDATAAVLLADHDLRVREAAVRAAGAAHVARLTSLLVDDPAADVRRAAADAFGRIGDPQLAEALVVGVEDRDSIVRAAVVRALGRLLSGDGAARFLCDQLRSGPAERRRASLYALAHIAPRDASASVCQLVDDPDPAMRLALVHVADALAESPERLVRHLAADPDLAVRHGAEMWLLRHAGSELSSRERPS